MARELSSWKQDAILQGKVMVAQVGTFSTPITGGGNGTVIDLDQPEAVISVPSGTAVRPIRFRIDCQAPLIAADNDEIEILVAVDRAAAQAAGTKTAETPVNMRTDLSTTLLGVTTAPTVTSAYTADMTDPTLTYELVHEVKVADVQGTAANALTTKLGVDYDTDAVPVVVGPAMIIVYWGGTVATTGFASLAYASYNTADLT